MIQFDEQARTDLERIFEFNFERDPASALEHTESIFDAVEILEKHPEIGRPVPGDPLQRELVISHGRTGYAALYHRSPVDGIIHVVAVRHQRESGYRGR